VSHQTTQPLFFRLLVRRDKYSRPSDVEHYAYAYYRANYHHEIAEDCADRCVYCDAHEDDVGGREAMQIDHFRPHGLPAFEHLKDVPENFHHSCARCNNWKRAKWPSTDPTASHDGLVGFIDPFADDRSLYFEVLHDGELRALHPVGNYLIKLLALNRPFLRLLRLRRLLRAQLEDFAQSRLDEWEAAARGEGTITREQIAKEVLKINQMWRLCSPKFCG
jgi:hypothetical protein